jgi:hypothetical protein
MNEPVEVLGDWKMAIGRFIVNFAGCERQVNMWAEHVFPVPDLRAVVRLPLARKAERVQAMMITTDSTYPPAYIDEIFTQLRSLAKFRNLIAHNPPGLTYTVAPDTGEVLTYVGLRSTINGIAEAKLHEIEARAAEAGELNAEMFRMSVAMVGRRLAESSINYFGSEVDEDEL